MLTVAHKLEVVRAELDARKHVTFKDTPARAVTILPTPKRKSSKHDIANGFSPTEPAAWPNSSRRWHVAVGALAIAASATMFVLTREPERANAAAPSHAAVEQSLEHAPVDTAPAQVVADHVAAPRAMAVPASAEPIPVVAPPTEPPAIKPVHSSLKSRSTPSRRSPVKPRRSPQPLDPDGTLDPYL
jgi:hypothetical protein